MSALALARSRPSLFPSRPAPPARAVVTRSPAACRNRLLFEGCEFPEGRPEGSSAAELAELHLSAADSRTRHCAAVLGSRAGDTVRVGFLGGFMADAAVTKVEPDGAVTLAVPLDARRHLRAPPPPRTSLLLAVPRPKVLKRLWAPVAALGVREIRLTAAARVERSYFTSQAIGEGLRRRELLRGLEQCGGDTRLPPVSVHKWLPTAAKAAAEAAGEGALLVLAHPEGRCEEAGLSAEPLAELAARAGAGCNAVLAIGPEGGWQAQELEALMGAGFRLGHLGSRTLTTESAVQCMLAVLKDGIGDI